jgi:FkbM family methyltransferase
MDVICGNEYRLPDRFGPEDVVIDVGAHIGAFSYAALVRGAEACMRSKRIRSITRIASHNVARFAGRVQCRNLAVWRSDQPQQLLFNDALTSFKPNTGGISVLWNDEGLPVASISLDDLLAEASRNFARRVRLLKLDCEGAEYPILYTSRRSRNRPMNCAANITISIPPKFPNVL